MRIRFLSPFRTALATFYDDLVPFLASSGCEVQIVISKAEYRAARDLEEAVGHPDRAKILRTISLGLQPNNSISKALVLAAYLVHTAVYTLFGPRVDLNVFSTGLPFLPLWGYFLSKVRRQPYYCLVMDIHPHSMIEYGMMRREAPLTKLLVWLAELGLRKAEGVIVLGRCMADRIEAMGVPSEHIHVIPNWMDERLVYPIDHDENQFRKSQGLVDKFVVLYSGNMGFSHYFDDILAVAEQMKDREKVTFVFIGDGSRHNEVKARVENRQLTNVVLLPFQDMNVLAQSLSAGDLHLVTLREACTGLSVPSKSYGILAAGRPILYQGSPRGEIAQMILGEDVGTVVSCGDVEGLEQSILKYLNQPDLCQVQGRKARALVDGAYSRARALERYAEALGVESGRRSG